MGKQPVQAHRAQHPEGPAPGLMLGRCCLENLYIFWTKGPHLLIFPRGPANYAANHHTLLHLSPFPCTRRFLSTWHQPSESPGCCLSMWQTLGSGQWEWEHYTPVAEQGQGSGCKSQLQVTWPRASNLTTPSLSFPIWRSSDHRPYFLGCCHDLFRDNHRARRRVSGISEF